MEGGSIRTDRELVFENQQVNIYTNPKEGYMLQNLMVNGKEVKVEEDGSFHIENVTGDLSVSGTFTQKNPLTVQSDSLEQTASLSAHYTASWEN